MTRNKHLTCGCCGDWFKTWTGYRDQDQDRGYGICQPCQVDDAWRDYEAMSGLIDTVRDALNPGNREKFAAMDRPLQDAIVYQMLDNGILSWRIGGRAA